MAFSSSSNLSSNSIVWQVHVEVRLGKGTSIPFETVRRLVYQYISENCTHLSPGTVISGWEVNPTLADSVERVWTCETERTIKIVHISQCSLQIHVFQPSENSAYERLATNPSDANEEYSAGTLSELPSRELEGLWESLFYDGDVKSSLLNYIQATISLSDANVDSNLVSWNRVVLLHGPPGTGKTSLCRALSQKLSIRLRERYNKTHLFEINSHSLFSRWFSESGKLVQNLFSTVDDMTSEEDNFVILLIDEVESLTSARSNAMSGNEPSDALRVVNALLTQIDRLKHQKNVLIMATSNLANAIDTAFVDRADIIQYIDYPPVEAVYEILRSSLIELMSRGVVEQVDVPPAENAANFHRLATMNRTTALTNGGVKRETEQSLLHPLPSSDPQNASNLVGANLFTIAQKCKGVSGRSLRRFPVLAHARCIGSMPVFISNQSSNARHRVQAVDVSVWLEAMNKAVDNQNSSRQHFQHV